MDNERKPLLSLRDLTVTFKNAGNVGSPAVEGVRLDICPAEILGLVGESGSGKTVLSLSTIGLLPKSGRITSGEILWNGVNLLQPDSGGWKDVRGTGIMIIMQNPQAALNPSFPVGRQLVDVIRLHHRVSRLEAKTEAIRLLRLVDIPEPEKRLRYYPHQLSGGMCQRVTVAIALSCQPRLLIADEPTSALDVTVQAEILDLLLEIRDRLQTAILLVSHDLGVIARLADRVAVLYSGRVVEIARSEDLYRSPLHPYTQVLLQSIPLPDPAFKGKSNVHVGELSNGIATISGCRFRTRCPKAFDLCSTIDPGLTYSNGESHQVACLLYGQISFTGTEKAGYT